MDLGIRCDRAVKFHHGLPQGFLPWDDVRWQLETFATEILPDCKD